MPLNKVTQNGQTCWKWGEKGKVYCGKDGKKKAIKQGIAISPEKFKQEMAKGDQNNLGVAAQVLAENGDFVGAMILNEIAKFRTKTVNVSADSEREAIKIAESANPNYKATSATPKSKGGKVYEVVLIRE